MTDNESFMRLAVELAYGGKGYTKTNPCVGAVVVSSGQVVGRGWHKAYGGRHAEINALLDSGDKAMGADLYVTLEPCTTFGKTPPCASAIIDAGVKRVYIGVLDPNPEHSGRAVEVFRRAGVETRCGVLASPCAELIEDFAKFQLTGRPYVTLKIAQSLDGKTATRTGDSKWISSDGSRTLVHEMRRRSDAVLVGIGTVLVDDPELTVRSVVSDRQPIRVVFDSTARLPLSSKLVSGAESGVAPLAVVVADIAEEAAVRELSDRGVTVITAGKYTVDIPLALEKLGKMGIMNILLEGGGKLAGAFLAANCVDNVRIFTAPLIIGGDTSKSSVGEPGAAFLKDAYRVNGLECVKSGDDFLFQGKLTDYVRVVLELTARRGGGN